jgi:5-methylcytosine-specific restriction endonuclease McrBC GTP-binding regulatory subunit McrB
MNGAGSNGTANQAYGVGVVWSKSFNSLFKKKKKIKKQRETEIKTDSVKSGVNNQNILMIFIIRVNYC